MKVFLIGEAVTQTDKGDLIHILDYCFTSNPVAYADRQEAEREAARLHTNRVQWYFEIDCLWDFYEIKKNVPFEKALSKRIARFRKESENPNSVTSIIQFRETSALDPMWEEEWKELESYIPFQLFKCIEVPVQGSSLRLAQGMLESKSKENE